jgi:phosphatidate cytidylyltransferase
LAESQQQENARPRRPIAGRTLAVRVAVGAVLIPIVLAVTYAGGLFYAIFVALLAALGAYEFTAMAARAGWHPGRILAIAGASAICLSFHFGAGALPGAVMSAVLVIILVERLTGSTREHYFADVASTFLGAVYCGWLLGHFIWLRNPGPRLAEVAGGAGLEVGVAAVYLVLVLTWTYDSVAYLAGSLLGRHKLIPRISPSKTVEGLAGGLVGCAVAGLVCRATFAPFLSIGEAVVVGLALGGIAQVGDVAESMLKRSTGAKDSSNLIPGHGGFLDRFDSLLFTGPALCLYLFYLRGFIR